MKSPVITLINLCLLPFLGGAQSGSIQGILQDAEGNPIVYANVALYETTDTLYKVGVSDEQGVFRIPTVESGLYYLKVTYVGLPEFRKADIALKEGELLDLGILKFEPTAIELETATVKASRVMVEVKPDRTVFNVEGTINSTGSNAIELLRKAPSVTVDNNDNVSVLGRAGVLLYVDGKLLPLRGDDLSNYLQNLPAEQIDRIEIITNPSAKYEAEGNAGIIDIRLKKDKNLGANGSLSLTAGQGFYSTGYLSGTGNYRNKVFNTFFNAGIGTGTRFNRMNFESFQNGVFLDEYNFGKYDYNNFDIRWGTDFFLGEKHTLGFLVNVGETDGNRYSINRIELSDQRSIDVIDSILVAKINANNIRNQQSYNINYRFEPNKETSLNVDLDYGRFDMENDRLLPNRYYDATETELLTEIINRFETPSDIDIYTAKIDFEHTIFGGKLGLGTKYSQVTSDNTFLVYDVEENGETRNDRSSNSFVYNEKVTAGYLTFNRPLGEKWRMYAGLRAEKTDATGDLTTFLTALEEPTVVLDYLQWFPSAGLTWQVAQEHALALNYGRRINRPDYQVLNPFNNQLSQLSYEKGNPALRPEIVNNIELGYTLKYRYNFKIGYSKTIDQITRLIAPDDEDPRAGFITWENLADQTIFSANISAPVQITPKWNAYFNISGSHTDNQADYGDGAVVDVQVFSWSLYQQQTFDLPAIFKAEVSGYYAGPGVWGGVFKYNAQWSLNLGLQRKFLQDQMNVRLSVNDIFYKSGWSGVSSFNGLVSEGSGEWDSRRVSLSINYNFGNQQVKSRKRKTGIEDEAGRVGQ